MGALDDGRVDDGALPSAEPPRVARALLEVIDRDGQVRQTMVVAHWPLHVGRALDNDVVLSDPHVAAHHFTVAPTGDGLALTVADTHNGVLLAGRRLRAGTWAALVPTFDAVELTAGRTRLRLRLPGHAIAAELAAAPTTSLARRLVPPMAAGVALVGGLLFTTYLSNDPDGYARAAGSMLMTVVVGAAVWCGAWALLSKTFAHQARFGWHLRVFLYASVALLAVENLPALLAFSFSWPAVADFAFVGQIALAAAALYFHLLAVEPARPRLMKWVAAACAATGIGLTLWFNVQRTGLYGDELYMGHLFPPALRVAPTIPADAFIDGLTPLKATLDKQALEPDRGDDGPRGEEE